jgi:hypothetical protein
MAIYSFDSHVLLTANVYKQFSSKEQPLLPSGQCLVDKEPLPLQLICKAIKYGTEQSARLNPNINLHLKNNRYIIILAFRKLHSTRKENS